MIEHLPVLGVGVSLSLSAQPDPVAIVQASGGADFVEYAGLVDASRVQAEVERIRTAGAPVLYHPSYINFCGSFANSPYWLQTTADHIAAVNSPWFAQDCAYCFWEDSPGYSTQLGYFIPPILNEASLQLALQRIREVQSAVPVPVAIEPPPMTFAVGTMPLFSFFGQLASQTGCAILLDMGHLVSYEMASGQDVCAALADLPCAQVVEVHIAGGRIKHSPDGDIYVDAHECAILEPTWHMLTKLLPHLSQLKAVCYECEGMDQATVLTTLSKVRALVRQYSGNPELVQVTGPFDSAQGALPERSRREAIINPLNRPASSPIKEADHEHQPAPASFARQEQALFDLLFDSKLRDRFAQQSGKALATYKLSATELADFAVIRSDALVFDARLRTDLILAQFCRSFPLSFSLLSSFDKGLDLIKSLIDSDTMRQTALNRLSYFGQRLRRETSQRLSNNEQLLAIISAEVAMASTSQRLKQQLQAGGSTPDIAPLPEDWLAQPLAVPAFVSVALLPQPYQILRQELCAFSGGELWRQLGRNPVDTETREWLLMPSEPRLLVCSAYVAEASLCDPVIEHRTAELSEGFAPLLDHVDGMISTNQILAQLKQLGASMAILQGVATSFRQLLRQGMLAFSHS